MLEIGKKKASEQFLFRRKIRIFASKVKGLFLGLLPFNFLYLLSVVSLENCVSSPSSFISRYLGGPFDSHKTKTCLGFLDYIRNVLLCAYDLTTGD